jgi:hypothetical protein
MIYSNMESWSKLRRAYGRLDCARQPAVKILIELSNEDYESLLNRTTEESPAYFRMKNAVKSQAGFINILCFPDEAEMPFRVAKQVNPDAALKIEQTIKDSRRA